MSGADFPPSKTRKLGRANVSVTELGLGTAPLGELFVKVEDDEAAAVIDAAWGAGAYAISTPLHGTDAGSPSIRSGARCTASRAPTSSYRPRSAGVLRRPLGPQRHQGSMARRPRIQTVFFDYSYDGVMRSFEDSLQRLWVVSTGSTFF